MIFRGSGFLAVVWCGSFPRFLSFSIFFFVASQANLTWNKCWMITLLIAQRQSYRNWPWRNGVNKTPPFIYFPIAKDGTRTTHLPIAEGCSFRSLYRCIKLVIRRMKKKDLIRVSRDFTRQHLNSLPNWPFKNKEALSYFFLRALRGWGEGKIHWKFLGLSI